VYGREIEQIFSPREPYSVPATLAML
jgi:hypothetical protein